MYEVIIQKSIKIIHRFKTLMTNKTEHDSHGSKTVEISDMKYNIFKVCSTSHLFFTHLLTYFEAVRAET